MVNGINVRWMKGVGWMKINIEWMMEEWNSILDEWNVKCMKINFGWMKMEWLDEWTL